MRPPWTALRELSEAGEIGLGSKVRLMARSMSYLIPANLIADCCPFTGSNGSDSVWVVDEKAPGALAGVEDIVESFPDESAEVVLAQIGPVVLHPYRAHGFAEKSCRRWR
jgi:hypothetical protein